MKVAFFSETGNNKKYSRDFPNSRTEVAWCLALDAPMCSLHARPKEQFDLGIVIIPKEHPKVSLDYIRGCCDKVAVMQEGPHWYFQDYDIDKQFHYYNCLIEADWVYCHNENDVSYYLGLGCKDVRVMRSLMIPEKLTPRTTSGAGHTYEHAEYDIDVTIIGGNFVSWYGGFDSYIVAREIGDLIHAPSMGRKKQKEEQIEDIKYLPYLSWREWIENLKRYNIGVHLMRTHAAGTFAMNCAFHGIPCIGYKGLDTQETCHPLTTVKVGELDKAVELGKMLKEQKKFYDLCSETSLKRFNESYTEKKWLENWNKQFK